MWPRGRVEDVRAANLFWTAGMGRHLGNFLKIYFGLNGQMANVEYGPWVDDFAEDEKPILNSKDDVYQPETLSWLLNKCGIPNHGWILNKFDPGRIVQVCCYTIHRQRIGKVKTNSVAYTISAFQDGWEVDDYRDEVLKSLFSKPAPRKTPEELIAEFKEADDVERQRAGDLLQQYLFGIGKSNPGSPPGDSKTPDASVTVPSNPRSSKGRSDRSK